MNLSSIKILFMFLLFVAVIKISTGKLASGLKSLEKHADIFGFHQAFSPSKNKILIDQLGYKPDDFKIAFFKNEDPGEFEIKNSETNETEFNSNAILTCDSDEATGDKIFSMNFSALTKPGNYYLFIPKLSLKSAAFSIRDDVYNECAIKALQSFYFQRCGTEVNNGTSWKHPPCHLKKAIFIDDPDRQKDETGGWHDAGDYNKFVPTTAVSAAFLLYAYENNPDFFKDGMLNIPEAKNSIPDVLDEARWGLDWLLKMQRQDGAVYHKVSIKNWTDEHLPQEETDQQFILGISTAATADEAAVTALGARLFSDYDKQFASKLLKAAVAAWNFLSKHPEEIPQGGFKNPPGVSGGDYNDDDDSDERLWASVELYRTTGSNEYLNYFLSNYAKVGGPNYTVGWKNTANFAFFSFMKVSNSDPVEKAKNTIVSNLKTYADYLLRKISESGYRCTLKPDEYFWGSNSLVLGYAFDLLNAYYLTSKKSYFEGALDQLHYIFGRNTFGISFVTGIGSYSVRFPYHQFSMLLDDGNPVPGMVVGGPNKFSKLNGEVISNFPGKCYEDNEKNYFVNEPAINYTAPLVFLASGLSIKKISNRIQSTIKIN